MRLWGGEAGQRTWNFSIITNLGLDARVNVFGAQVKGLILSRRFSELKDLLDVSVSSHYSPQARPLIFIASCFLYVSQNTTHCRQQQSNTSVSLTLSMRNEAISVVFQDSCFSYCLIVYMGAVLYMMLRDRIFWIVDPAAFHINYVYPLSSTLGWYANTIKLSIQQEFSSGRQKFMMYWTNTV